MKRIIEIITYFLFVSLFLLGCDNISDNLVDSNYPDYEILEINAPEFFNYSDNDSIFSHSVVISNSHVVSSIKFSLISHLMDAYLIQNGDMNLTDRTVDNATYSAEFVMMYDLPSGLYEIMYFVEDNINVEPENSKKAASHTFIYYNGIGNQPPVISNLSMRYVDEPISTLRDTVDRNEDVIWSIFVNDPNSIVDVNKVSFEMYRPDNSFLGEFDMYDNGDFEGAGDQTAGDQTYSLKNSFSSTAQTGLWQMKFKAVDREGEQSNIINFGFYVK
ncbi:MAG: hypothetical protein PHW27_04445 [Melioribacteraceae bacterium]|nr:hypothetical protein [Melioribacteraceae bacterium]MDD3557803.1 hypothetical protein [Melioribacteraceae bacterium]